MHGGAATFKLLELPKTTREATEAHLDRVRACGRRWAAKVASGDGDGNGDDGKLDFRWLQRRNGSINKVLSTTASRQIWSNTEQGQSRTVEHWPRWGEHDGGVAGREEERQRAAFLGEIKWPELVGWVRKEQAELRRLCSDWKDTTAMTQARWSNGGGIGKTEETNGKKRRRWRPYSAAQKHKEATQEPSLRQREAKDGHECAWKPEEGRRRWGGFLGYCSPKLQNCHSI